MILIDDDKKQIIENLKNKVSEDNIVYDFDLMKNGILKIQNLTLQLVLFKYS